MELSKKIKEICKANGTSIAAVERELGLGNGTIGKWGKNGRVPNYANLCAVAARLGVTIDSLMSDNDIEEKGIKNTLDPKIEGMSAAKQALLASIDDLTDEQCEKLLPIVLSAKTVL